MKIIFAILLLVISFSTLNASPQSPDNEIINGLNEIYNLRFDNAEKTFLNIQKSNPGDLSGYFYESLIYFYKALPTRDEGMYDKFLELSEKVIDKAEANLDKNDKDYDALYYKGLSHSYRSLLMLSINKNLLQAASNGNDGYRILSSLIEAKPDYYDAYMGLGLYKIAIGFVPEKFQFLLSLIGFSGNINEGIRLLKTSMDKGKFTKIDSRIFLSLFSIKEREDEDGYSLGLSSQLINDYPESPVLRIFYSTILLQSGLTEDAIKESEAALELNKNSFQNEIKKAAFSILGISYFRLNDFNRASENLEESMKYVNSEDRYNVYLFTLATAYELNGEREKALDKYKTVRNNYVDERDGELDKFFYRYAQDKIRKPLSEFEVKLVEGMNLRESNKPGEAIDLYKSMIDSRLTEKYKDDDALIKFYFDMGLAYMYSKSFDNAEESFLKCIKLQPQNEKWLIPHAYFELGKVYVRKNNKKRSEEMFEKIYDYDDFDFESFLEMRLANYRGN